MNTNQPLPPTESPVAAPPPPMRPWIRALIVAAVAFLASLLAAIILPAALPHADQDRLSRAIGSLSVNLAIATFVISWLWFAKRKILALVTLAAIALFVAVGFTGVRSAVRRSNAMFPRAASTGFTLSHAGGRTLLKHDGFGLSADLPGVWRQISAANDLEPHTFTWAFQDPTDGKSLVILASHELLDSADDAKMSVQHFLTGMRESAERKGMPLSASDAVAAWNQDERCAEADGYLAQAFFSVRTCASGTGYPGFNATFSAEAFAADPATARELARSLRATGSSVWAASPPKLAQ